MPHSQALPDAFLKDPALKPYRDRTASWDEIPGLVYFTCDGLGKAKLSDGLTAVDVNVAIFSHFTEVFRSILEEKGRGMIFSTIDHEKGERKSLVADTHTHTATIVDHRVAQALAVTVNYPEYVSPP